MKRCLFSIALIMLMAAALVLSAFSQRPYYLTALVILLLTLVLFALHFERRRPSARELVLLAALCALAVASRWAFAALPHCKPVFGVLMIIGLALGPVPGFLCGAMSAFASNFFFGQGPWTPWQMVAFGVAGLMGGLFSGYSDALLRRRWGGAVLAACSFLSVVLLVGPILDTCTVFLMFSHLTKESICAIYLAGLVPNCINGAAAAAVMLAAGRPLLGKIRRLQRKYGLYGC